MKALIGLKTYPGKFLASLTNEADKDYAIESKKILAFRFYEAAQDGLQDVPVYMGSTENDRNKKEFEIKRCILDTMHLYGVVKSYKIITEKTNSIYAEASFDPEEAIYFYKNIDEHYPYGYTSIEKHFKDLSGMNTINNLESNKPFCTQKDGIGYIQFGTNGGKTEVGKAYNQPFKLVQCLLSPFGVAKSLEGIFEAIRENSYKKSKSGVFTAPIDRLQKIKQIEYVIKELQKGNKLKGKLKFKWDDTKNKLWIEYIP